MRESYDDDDDYVENTQKQFGTGDIVLSKLFQEKKESITHTSSMSVFI